MTQTHMTCSKETKEEIMGSCIQLFLQEHPEMIGMNLSQGFILKKIKDYYLK